jgi:hypothetical protein
MDYQVMFNIVLGGFSFLAGFLLNNIWSEIKQLQENERETTVRISAIEVLVAGQYVKRDEYRHDIEKLFEKVDSIISSLSAKADK